MDESTAQQGEPPAEAAPEAGADLQWYIIHTYSRFEKQVREALQSRIEALDMKERLGEILIPTENVVEVRNGQKRTVERLLYPGYVLVQLDLDDALWHAVKNTPKVTGFVGGGQSPTPLTSNEVNEILHRQQSSEDHPRPHMEFARNDRVSIVDGPFTGFSGSVEEVNADRSTLKVMVTIFGRATPVQLEYFQVKKAT